ncbi:hypothetical protein CLPU_15c00480 [Gottschalkia purinilytica]|uniref:Uncharacterized protein n=1 Tax=Gottschalkia purinilytica TaxID=1503 RepID=A0A0L0W7P1_GOTPU|nr:hypothetical protein [Gottschalkia purinilytica]KNF07554.1 hypothetical protein CLPU_15c00480 [Gottschalkia purinilytica]
MKLLVKPHKYVGSMCVCIDKCGSNCGTYWGSCVPNCPGYTCSRYAIAA